MTDDRHLKWSFEPLCICLYPGLNLGPLYYKGGVLPTRPQWQMSQLMFKHGKTTFYKCWVQTLGCPFWFINNPIAKIKLIYKPTQLLLIYTRHSHISLYIFFFLSEHSCFKEKHSVLVEIQPKI